MPKRPAGMLGDVRGAVRLVIDGVHGVTGIVEAVHRRIARAALPWGKLPGEPAGGISGLVYRGIHGATQLVGKALDAALAGLQASPGAGQGIRRCRRERTLHQPVHVRPHDAPHQREPQRRVRAMDQYAVGLEIRCAPVQRGWQRLHRCRARPRPERIFIDVEATVEGWTQDRDSIFRVPTVGTLVPAAAGAQGASGDWLNEIHPNRAGWAKLAKVWRREIRKVLPP